jgi:hypothetical protein
VRLSFCQRVGAIPIGSARSSREQQNEHKIEVIEWNQQEPVVDARSIKIMKAFHGLES